MIEILHDYELPFRAPGEIAASPSALSAAQLAGVRYEARVTNWLMFYKQFYPQIAFRINGQVRIPDGLLYCKPDWLVIEIKTQFSHEAEWQLREYQAFLSAWLRRPAKALLICREYRPELASLPVVASLANAYTHSFSVLPLGARNLGGSRRLAWAKYDGLGLVGSASAPAIWASGRVGDCADSIQRVSSLELVS